MADQAPEQVIEIPGVGRVAFPASMSEAQINAASTKMYQEANPDKKQPPVKSWLDTAVEWLPAAGSFVGGAMGVEAGPVGIGLGAGAGGALGKAVQQKIQVMRGQQDEPATVLDALTPVATQGAKDAVYGAVGGAVLGKVASALPSPATAARGVTAAGNAMVNAADSSAVRWGSRTLAGLLGIKGDLGNGAVALGLPPALRAAGGKVVAAGTALESRFGAGAAATAIKDRLAQIPIAGAESEAADLARAAIQARLRKIPLADRLAAIPEQMLSADVELVRQAIASGKIPFEKAITAAAEGSAEYAAALKTAVVDSIKTKGVPVPDAVLKLLQSKSFANLPKP